MSGYISPDALQALGVPSALAERYAPYLSATFEAYDITTPNRKAAFLARACGAETSGLQRLTEIASGRAYNNRKDLGNGAEDGPTFKGRGAMQLTGRDAYTQYTAFVRGRWSAIRQRYSALLALPSTAPSFVTHPALIAELPWSMDSAGWFWKHYKSWLHFNTLADAGRFDAISQGINGGNNGLGDYRKALQVAHVAIARQGAAPPPAPTLASQQGPVVSSPSLPPATSIPVLQAGLPTGPLVDLARILGIRIPGATPANQFSSGMAPLFAPSPSLAPAPKTLLPLPSPATSTANAVRQQEIIAGVPNAALLGGIALVGVLLFMPRSPQPA